MKSEPQHSGRRTVSLSRDRIMLAAVDILDAGGETALTFRTLAASLATGPGAIYNHVASKDELLAAAANGVIAHALDSADIARGDPRQQIRALALAIFDALDDHAWIGSQLATAPSQSAMTHIIEHIGTRVAALGVPSSTLFDSVFALVNYIVGVAGQNAANARLHTPGTDRSTVLGAVADRWSQLDPTHFPFVTGIASQLPEHDDRQQFAFGVDLFLEGIQATR